MLFHTDKKLFLNLIFLWDRKSPICNLQAMNKAYLVINLGVVIKILRGRTKAVWI